MMMERVFRVSVLATMLVVAVGRRMAASDSLLVDLDAAGLGHRELTVWQNHGRRGGSYRKYETNPAPTVETVGITRAVAFETGDVFVSTFNVPAGITVSSDWTIEAWLCNPDVRWQQPLSSWQRRGGITQNASVNYSTGWGGAVNDLYVYFGDFAGDAPPAASYWRYPAFTYAGSASDMMERVYVDGVLNTSFNLSAGPHDLRADDFTSMGTVYQSGEGWIWGGTQWVWGTVEGWMARQSFLVAIVLACAVVLTCPASIQAQNITPLGSKGPVGHVTSSPVPVDVDSYEKRQ